MLYRGSRRTQKSARAARIDFVLRGAEMKVNVLRLGNAHSLYTVKQRTSHFRISAAGSLVI